MAHMSAHLLRCGRNARNRMSALFHCGQVAGDEDVRMTRHAEIGANDHPTCAVPGTPRVCPSGDAATPAAQTTVCDATNSSPIR